MLCAKLCDHKLEKKRKQYMYFKVRETMTLKV